MKAKESKEEKIIYLENALKNKFAATWVKILLVTSFLETSIFFCWPEDEAVLQRDGLFLYLAYKYIYAHMHYIYI